MGNCITVFKKEERVINLGNIRFGIETTSQLHLGVARRNKEAVEQNKQPNKRNNRRPSALEAVQNAQMYSLLDKDKSGPRMRECRKLETFALSQGKRARYHTYLSMVKSWVLKITGER